MYLTLITNTISSSHRKLSYVFVLLLCIGPGLPISTLHDGRTDQGMLSCMLFPVYRQTA